MLRSDTRKNNRLVNSLEKSINRLVQDLEYDRVLQSQVLSKKDGHRVRVGNYTLEKTSANTVDIIDNRTKQTLYEDLYSADAALALIEQLTLNNMWAVKQIEKAEVEYCRHYLELTQLRHSIKTKPDSKISLENRCGVVQERLQLAHQKIRRFRFLRF